MPTELTPDDIRRFERRLREQRDALRRQIHDTLIAAQREDYAELAGRVHDAGEESVAELVRSLNFTMLDRELNELRDVEDAIERVRVGSYGFCIDCGRPIERERLEVKPTATRDIVHQTRYERGYRDGRDATPSL